MIAIFQNLNQIRYGDTLLGVATIVVLVLLKVQIPLALKVQVLLK